MRATKVGAWRGLLGVRLWDFDWWSCPYQVVLGSAQATERVSAANSSRCALAACWSRIE